MFANSDQHLGSCNLEPGTLELIKVAGVYFIAPLSNLPNYRGVKLRSKLPSATAFVKVDRTTAHFTAVTLKNNVLIKSITAMWAAVILSQIKMVLHI